MFSILPLASSGCCSTLYYPSLSLSLVCVCVCVCVCRHTVVATVTRFPSIRSYLRDCVPCNGRIEAKETVLVTETFYCEIPAEVEETVESRAHDINGTKKSDCALIDEINV
jgi:hypothetical protein